VKTLWPGILDEVRQRQLAEPALRRLLHDAVLRWDDPARALAWRLAQRLAGSGESVGLLWGLLLEPLQTDSRLLDAAEADLLACRERDPACHALHLPFLFYKGFHALQVHRAAHAHWLAGRRTSATLLQHRCSEALAVDIHPAAQLGSGLLLDHATGFVAGETAIVEDGVSLLHGVTLGGTGKQGGDRHPVLRRGCSLGAGALLLGRIEIGPGARVGAGSVVLTDVPGACTAVGQRARLVTRAPANSPAQSDVVPAWAKGPSRCSGSA